MSKAFDPNKDYMEEMRRAAAEGNEEGFNAAQTARNSKITTNGLNYPTTNYNMQDFAKQNGIATVPQVNPNPGRTFSPDVNYTAEMMKDIGNGNLFGAMYNENKHNEKDGALGLGWGTSGMFNYQDRQGLGGLKEGKYREIEDYFDAGFNYDYATDPEYLAMKRLKEKEADKAYKDGYAQLSRQFDGDIPVNMINKLLTTKAEIEDQADGYIPTLKQMAYDKYLGKGNQLMSQYGLLSDMEQNQYQRFLSDRDFYAQGVINDYANRKNEEAFDYQKQGDSFNRLLDLATIYYNDDPNITWNEAIKRARSSGILY